MPSSKKKTLKEKKATWDAQMEWHSSHIFIGYSLIPGAGLGVFTKITIPPRIPIGYYKGAPVSKYLETHKSNYKFNHLDALDPEGNSLILTLPIARPHETIHFLPQFVWQDFIFYLSANCDQKIEYRKSN